MWICHFAHKFAPGSELTRAALKKQMTAFDWLMIIKIGPDGET